MVWLGLILSSMKLGTYLLTTITIGCHRRFHRRAQLEAALNNGRPRCGEVHRCYKNVKILFRKLSGQCIYSHNDELYQSLDALLPVYTLCC